ncbi:hypothetical protein H9P43_005742 [Blastocladiella emersonii ATCC 22665]|nr:hypothetical protein H9P43_005742 [Blastocladiella emersonii ATCC 22665]
MKRDTTTGAFVRENRGANKQLVYDDKKGLRVVQRNRNGDGRYDVTKSYRDGKLVWAAADTNGNYQMDYFMTTGADGSITYTYDKNEDGIAERTIVVKDGVSIEQHDYDGNGKVNATVHRYADGTTYTEYDISNDGILDAATTYRDGRLVSGAYDRSYDGVLDTSVVRNAGDGKYNMFKDTGQDGTFETELGPDNGALSNFLNSVARFTEFRDVNVGYEA